MKAIGPTFANAEPIHLLLYNNDTIFDACRSYGDSCLSRLAPLLLDLGHEQVLERFSYCNFSRVKFGPFFNIFPLQETSYS